MLEVIDLRVTFGATVALDDVSLTVPDSSTTAVLGPSGSGKSTLLRAIAGLQPLDGGRVLWDGVDVTNVAVHRRGFGLMFQDFALFPHLTVAGNVAFGLEMSDHPVPRARVAEVLGLVGLEAFADRTIHGLSGGEQQRVALARALAPEPTLLMFDEPLGSVDQALRGSLVAELRQLLDELATTAIYVTHDQEEAFAVADHIVVMRQGYIEQVGTPEELWRRPATPFVATFLGFDAATTAQVYAGRADTPLGPFPADIADGRYTMVIPPDAVATGPGIEATVQAVSFRAGAYVHRAAAGDTILTVHSLERHEPGTTIGLTIDTDRLLFYPA